MVEGRLRLEQWEERDKAKRSKLKVVIENFQFVDSRQAAQPAEADTAAV